MKKRSAADAPPPSTTFQLLWGTRDKTARGPRPAFRLEQVVKAGVEIVDAGGLSALTMASVAERLDVTAMALYRYVPSKDALIDLVADAVLARPPKPAGASWRADISAWGRADLARLRRHPWLLDIVSTRTEVGPNWARWLDAGLQCLEPLPFSVSEKMAAFLLVDGHCRAAAQLLVGAKSSPAWANGFNRMLQSVAGRPHYPALSALMAGGTSKASDLNLQGMIDFGFERLLDGIEMLGTIRSRR